LLPSFVFFFFDAAFLALICLATARWLWRSSLVSSFVGFPFAFATGPAREFLVITAIIVLIATKAHNATEEVAGRLFSGITTEVTTEISYQIVAAAAAASTAATTTTSPT
jgi:hypothetical protein